MYYVQPSSLIAQLVKNLSAVQETWVWSLGLEGTMEKEMATHSSILAWKIPWPDDPGGLQSMRLQRVGHDWAINMCTAPIEISTQIMEAKYSGTLFLTCHILWLGFYQNLACTYN